MMDVITGKTRPDRGRAFFGSSTIDLLRYKEARSPRMRHWAKVSETYGV
jgi:ABC-type uncharacterized transport system ATPase subunit